MRMFVYSAFAALAACGGGGSSSPAPAPPPPPPPMASAPVAPVIVAFAQTSATYTANATNGESLSLTVATGPTAQLSPSTPASSTYDATGVIRQGGQIAASSSYRVFYNAAPFKVLGVQLPGGNGTIVYVASQNADVPASAQVGASALIFAAPIPPSTIGVGPLSATWSVEADSPTTAFVCINTTRDSGLVNNVHAVESDCFKVNSAGAIQGFRAVSTVNGVTTIFQ